MPRSRALLACAVSLSVASWSVVAAAQTDGAPVPPPSEPPAAPTPGDAAPPAPPPAAPGPSAPTPPPTAAPPADSPPTPSTPPGAGPATGAFPLPPEATPTVKKPPSRSVAPPPAAFEEPTSAAPPPATAPPAQKPSDGLFAGPVPENRRHQDEGEGTDQFKIGPVVGLGIPSVISFGGTMKLTRFLGAGVNIGLIPKVKLSYYGDATLSYQHYDIYGRLYPFGGGFFLSGGAGYATVDGTLSSSKTVAANGFAGTVDYNSKGSVRTLMLTALIGYFYTTSIGFSFGVDAGAQIPIAPSQVSYSSEYKVTTSVAGPLGAAAQAEAEKQAAPIVTASDKSVRDTLEKIGRSTLPTINLRIGWIL